MLAASVLRETETVNFSDIFKIIGDLDIILVLLDSCIFWIASDQIVVIFFHHWNVFKKSLDTNC